MEFVDTHCHPHFDNFLPEPQKVLAAAAAAGVTRIIAVGTTVDDSQKAAAFAGANKNIWATAGVHPHEAEKFMVSKSEQNRLVEILNTSSIVAVGEIGLDYYKNYSKKEDQIKALRQQIELGLPTGLPFIFHIRDAWQDFWPIFDSYSDLRGIIHSFSTGTEQLEEVLKRDLLVGLNGIMTFTKDESQLEAAKRVPLSNLVLETDAPFLAPAPFRGQTCEPKHIKTIAEFLADLRDEKLEDLAKATTANAIKVFGL